MKSAVILASIAVLLLAGATGAQAPEYRLVDLTCSGHRITGLVMEIAPSTNTRRVMITLDHSVCLPPATGT